MNDLFDPNLVQEDQLLSEADLPSAVYDSFKSRGLSHAGALAMTAEVGRENNFQSKWLFGIHTDPANKATNIGMFSWQKDRATALRQNLEGLGLVEGDKIKNSRRALDAMVDFSLQELERPEYGGGSITQALKGDVDRKHAAELLGRKYIRWAYDNPVYASGHRNRDFWYDKVARQKGQGLTQLPQREATMFDSNREAERTSKPMEAVTESPGFFSLPSISAGFQSEKDRYRGEIREARDKYLDDAYKQLEELSGVERPSEWKRSMLNLLPRALGDVSTSVLEKDQDTRFEKFNTYLQQIQEARPDLKLPFQSSMDIERLAAQEIIANKIQGSETLENLYQQGGIANDTGVVVGSLIGGMGAFLNDWDNLKTTVAGATVTGGASFLGQVAASIGVNVAQEVYADYNARDMEAKIGIDRSVEETLTGVGMAAAVGAAVPVVGRAIKGAFRAASKAMKPKMKGEINEILSDTSGVNPDLNPFGDSDIGAAKFDALAKESVEAFERAGEAPSPVTRDTPAVYDEDVAAAIRYETESYDADMRKVLSDLDDPELMKVYDDIVAQRQAEIEAAPKVGREEYEEIVARQTPEEKSISRQDMTPPAEDTFKQQLAAKEKLVTDLTEQAPLKRSEKTLLDALDEIESNAIMDDVTAIENIRATKTLSEKQIADLDSKLEAVKSSKDQALISIEEPDGSIRTITTREFRAELKAERTALEAVTSCAASIGV